jgi:polyisoprenoid-binding protein YceI
VLSMTMTSGTHHLGSDTGQLVLRTFRDGLAATAGHDLVIDVPRWSGELTVGPDGAPAGLEVHADLGSLAVREGTGGLKPLTDRDRREILGNARKLLGTDRQPDAVFTATRFGLTGDGGTVEGTFTLRGVSRPLRLQVARIAPGRYRATGTVVQSEYGIKPYSAFFGALKVRDPVDVEVEAAVPESDA